jgi:DNA invertase Pin-like site-specific DNA recombinase
MKAPAIYEEEIRRYCGYRKLTLSKLYSDIDYSAFRGAKPRPSLEQLVSDRHRYSAVIIPKLSRFGRSVKELVRLFDVFDGDGIPLVFLDMNLDTSTSQGRLLRHIMSAFAEYESDVKADYARANHRRIRAEGRPWGVAPFGYRRGEHGGWGIDHDEAPVVRAIFTRYAAGESANAIASELNDLGVTTRRGLAWKGQTIGKLLDNPAYAALSLIDDELVPARWEELVSRETWDQVRARRQADPRRMHNLGRTKPHKPYLLSGLMWCGQCGRRMTHTVSTRDKRGVYHCAGSRWAQWNACLNARVYAELAEAYVADAFLERCAFTILTESGQRAGEPKTVWAKASLGERQRLLGLVVERIVATPVNEDVPRSEYRTRLRHDLSIQWKADIVEGQEVAVVAQAPRPDRPRGIKPQTSRHANMRALELRRLIDAERAVHQLEVSPGMSWDEWRRVRLGPDEPSEADAAGRSWNEWRRARLLPR